MENEKNENTITLHLMCASAAKAIEFYKKVFHATEETRMPMPDGRLMHAALRIGNSLLMLADDFPEHTGGKSTTPKAFGGSPVRINILVDDVDQTINRAKEHGATITMPPSDMFWGDRYAQFTDPEGHTFAVLKHIQKLTPEQIKANAAKMFAAKK